MQNDTYLDSIKKAIDSGEIVSFRWLSESLSVSSNEAKQLLYEYSLEYPDDIKIIYCVIGTNAETDIRTVTLTSQEKLESVKSKINSITTIHVYSIQKSIPKDFNLLCARECNLKTAGYQNSCKNPELILEKAKLCPLRIPVKIRTETIIANTPIKQEVKKDTKKEITKSQPKKENMKKDKSTTTKSSTKASTKSSTPKQSNIDNSVLQKLVQPKPMSVLGKRSIASRPEGDEQGNKKKKKVDTPLFFSPVEKKKSSPANSGGLTKYDIGEPKKRRLKRMNSSQNSEGDAMDLWNSDDEFRSPSPILGSSDSEPESPEDVPPPVSPKKSSPFDKYKVAGTSRISPTKTTTTKTKTKKDDKGYLVFSDEVVESDIPVPEPKTTKTEKKKAKPAPKKTSEASKKQSPKSVQQKSLLNFFKK